MQISVLDASNYFRGLLLLIRMDRKVTPVEVDLMSRVGKVLGFEKGFCEQAIHDILDNMYVSDSPPVFSTADLARKFVKDGLVLACSDEEFEPAEEEWLLNTAIANGLDAAWFGRVRESVLRRQTHTAPLEIEEVEVNPLVPIRG